MSDTARIDPNRAYHRAPYRFERTVDTCHWPTHAAPCEHRVTVGEAPRPFQTCRPDWWGEHGCRHAGETGHVCVDVFGRPPAETRRPCVAEARAAMAELFETYRAVAC